MGTGLLPRRSNLRPNAPDLAWHVGGTAAAVGVFLFVMATIPAGAKELQSDSLRDINRYQGGIIVRPLVDPDEQVPDWMQKKQKTGGDRGKAHAGESGKMGSRTSKNKDGLVGLKGPKETPDPHLAKTLAEDAAKNAGVLGVFRQSQSSHIASIFGRDSALGRDAINALGGLIGAELQEAYGVPGGLGLVGTKKGGGGTGEGTFGVGNLGTLGKCVGDACGPGADIGYWRRGPRIDGVKRLGTGPEVTGGIVKTRGRLDKEIIRRVIRSHLKEVKYCYETELVRKPDLYGRLTVQFAITPTGTVSSSAVEQSTVGNRNVEQCIAAAVRRWTFPQPEDGGVVLVTYPFVLQAPAGR
jgi:TonB family protein